MSSSIAPQDPISNQCSMNNNLWIGRFAPTPSGPLHFGSLVAALGSYLIAKSNNGQWLVRIEDLDPPREVSGAAKSILQTLEAFGFEWDLDVVYQSQRQSLYQDALASLKSDGLIYDCDCSRKLILQRNQGIYDGYCINRKLNKSQNAAIRVQFTQQFDQFKSFNDGVLGGCIFNQKEDKQDFVIRRRDGLFAYQLAVVVDDIEQGINHVVRGADILDSTPRQNFLYACLKQPEPGYYHLPLVLNQQSEKLSKSKFSAAIEPHQASFWLIKAFKHLGQALNTEFSQQEHEHSEMITATPNEILSWAIKHWDTSKVGTSPIAYDELI